MPLAGQADYLGSPLSSLAHLVLVVPLLLSLASNPCSGVGCVCVCVSVHGLCLFLFGSFCADTSLLPTSLLTATPLPPLSSAALSLSFHVSDPSLPVWIVFLSPRPPHLTPFPWSHSLPGVQAAPLLCHHPRRRPDSAELRPLGAPPATFALFTQLWPTHSSAPPALWRCLRKCPALSAAWRLCTVCGQLLGGRGHHPNPMDPPR